jgi:protein-histidine pros-kinase
MTKFNLILLVLFGTGGILIAQAAYTFLMNGARREVLQQAEVLMASAEAARNYMSETLEPLLDQVPVRNGEFRAETVPNVGAIATSPGTAGRVQLLINCCRNFIDQNENPTQAKEA